LIPAGRGFPLMCNCQIPDALPPKVGTRGLLFEGGPGCLRGLQKPLSPGNGGITEAGLNVNKQAFEVACHDT
jgi:hypothetical protein